MRREHIAVLNAFLLAARVRHWWRRCVPPFRDRLRLQDGVREFGVVHLIDGLEMLVHLVHDLRPLQPSASRARRRLAVRQLLEQVKRPLRKLARILLGILLGESFASSAISSKFLA